MKRVDSISDLMLKCTGCMACVDACPTACIASYENSDGFKYSAIDVQKCIDCGKCYAVCPIESYTKHNGDQHLYAAYAKNRQRRNGGSSGGIFSLLAEMFLRDGYYVSGAAFEGTTLKHRVVKEIDQLSPLLKSKYLQSDTEGIYLQIKKILSDDGRVFFCGTPCQVSSLINFIPPHLKDRLITADIICHGVPSQKTFDGYISALEKKHNGRVIDFSFRVKDNKYHHAHGYSYQVERGKKTYTINGIYTQSSFYNAFKNYLIFREGCYDCQYTTVERVSDITLADFWGIEKYEFNANVDTGVSMVITNTDVGHMAFERIVQHIEHKEFPLQYGIDSNYCLTHSTQKPKNRDQIIQKLATVGYEKTANEFFKSSVIQKAYWFIPAKVRALIRKIRGR